MGAPAPVSYTVTGITDDSTFSPTNTMIAGKRVAFKTSTGYEGSVFVPAGVFSDLAAVRGLIEGEVRLVAAAQAITGTVGG